MTSIVLRRKFVTIAAILLAMVGAVAAWLLPANNYLSPLYFLAGGTIAALITWWRTQYPLLVLEEFSTSLQTSRAGLLVTDLEGRIIVANDKVAHMLKQEVTAIDGALVGKLIGDDLWRSLLVQQDTSTPGGSVESKFELPEDNGTKRTLTCCVKPICKKSGKPSGYSIELTDISSEKSSKRSLKIAAAQLRRTLSKSSDIILIIDTKLIVTFANDNARNLLSADGPDLVGRPLHDFIRTQDRRNFMKTMEQFLHKTRNEASSPELQLNDADETPVTARIVRLSEPGQNGYIVIFGFVEHDLQTLADAKVSQARFYQVFHGSPDAILLLRADDITVLDFNEGFSRLLGYSREETIGESELDLSFWANANERAMIIERVRLEREVLDYETTLRTRDGVIVHVEISLRYVEIDNQLCMLCIGRDITKRISAEAALVESEEKFEKVFSQSPDGIVILRESDGVITDLNEAMLSRCGYLREEMIGKSVDELENFVQPEEWQTATDLVREEGTLVNQTVTLRNKQGEELPSSISATTVELSGEAFTMVIAKDISKQRATEKRLRRSEERFRGIFENAPIGIMLIDMQGRIFQANHTAATLLAYDEDDLLGTHLSRLVSSVDRQSLKESLSDLIVKQDRTHRSERRMICQNGLEIWTNFHVVLQPNDASEALYYIVQIADITDIKRSQQRMEQMAFYDTLTNLANRRLFHERLEKAIEHCIRTNRESALLFLDLDNFKRVNDTLGHQIGDHLLREVAARLQQCVRKEDTVGRTGGDEFTILLAEITSPTDAGVVAQKILNHLREPIHVSGHPLIVTTSIGITVLPGDALDANELMRNADLAMYKAKERGRNNFQYYSEDLNTNAIKRLRTEYEIRQALEHHEFELYFQPKVAIRSRQIVGLESLIRWNHPERGLLAPDEFIGVAEETGSIIDIGTWVIEEACRACRTLSDRQGQPIQMAINISPRQFRDPNLVSTVRRSLREADLVPECIEIEITETMLMQDVEAALATAEQLSELGVSIAIDDFGTGYSSLNYLKRFPINTVKIDRSFVTDLPTNPDDMAITRAVIAMAHQLKMEVVAEGVETIPQLDFLAQQKCEYAQGWLFSKALPLDEVGRLLTYDLGVIRVG